MFKLKIFALTVSLSILFYNLGNAQYTVKDTSLLTPMFYASYALQFPGGDMVKRFGMNSNIGGGFQVKLRSNWVLGLDFNYLFGNNVKGETQLLQNISTSSGYIIDGNGEYADVFLYERGFYASARVGYVIPVLSPNPNSGFFVYVSGGFLKHKIRIDNPNNTAPQLSDEYRLGYDHMTNGWGISEFVGYLYLGNQRLVSFFGGFEFNQAWTKCKRYNFDEMAKDESTHFDQLVGIKVGWIIPLYKRKPKGYYYN
jgi:hypothetical protein